MRPSRGALAATLVAAAAVPPNVAVSRAPGPQSEVAVAVSRSSSGVALLAGSVDRAIGWTRVYTSADGRTWTSAPGPGRPAKGVCHGDPAVDIDGRGRQYFAVLAYSCRRRENTARVEVYSRAISRGPWTRHVLALAARMPADRPFVAAARRGSGAYVGWTSHRGRVANLAVARSTDGMHWTRPVALPGRETRLSGAAAVAGDGSLVVAWWNPYVGSIGVARTRDGGRSFIASRRTSIRFSTIVLAAGLRDTVATAAGPRSVTPSPNVALAAGDVVYVAFTDLGPHDVGRTSLLAFDRALRPVEVASRPDRRPGAQFLPALAVDPASNTIWTCHYRTVRPTNVRARFDCAASRNGGRTWSVSHAADRASNETAPAADRAFGYGDYAGVAALGGRAYALWTDSRDLAVRGEEIYAAVLSERAAVPNRGG